MKKSTQHIVRSKRLTALSGIIHGFTDKSWGDMRESVHRDAVFQSLGISSHTMVWPEQVHSTAVHKVVGEDMGKIVRGADALVLKYVQHGEIMEPCPLLAVHVADCVPMLFADPVAGIVAAAHAGWRGTLAGIAQGVVTKMKDLGAEEKHIIVCFGPHIGDCCYNVPEKRAQQFWNRYGNDRSIVRSTRLHTYVNLGKANYTDLVAAGVKEEHIDDIGVCTSCNNDTYFSYRKDKNGTFGEIMGFIGYRA